MTKRVLIIGGYGNFGQRIAELLARESNCQLIIGGRDINKAKRLTRILKTHKPAEAVHLDIHQRLDNALKRIAPAIVIHTSGPYQGQDYHVARTCIEHGCHYIDLADARDFVSGIDVLHQQAEEKGILICSGASSVPALSSALIDEYLGEFASLDSVRYGISTAQRTGRGLATTSAVLSYAGKPFTTLVNGQFKNVYGWLGLSFRKFWKLNYRPLGNCDIPDLELFPRTYPSLSSIQFQAGLEVKLIHTVLFFLSWLVRVKMIRSLQPLAPHLLKLAGIFDFMGSNDSGFFMEMTDKNQSDRILFELSARSGDGLYIPCIPSVLLAKKLIRGEINKTGAFPCMGFIKLDEYLKALEEFDINWRVQKYLNARARPSCSTS